MPPRRIEQHVDQPIHGTLGRGKARCRQTQATGHRGAHCIEREPLALDGAGALPVLHKDGRHRLQREVGVKQSVGAGDRAGLRPTFKGRASADLVARADGVLNADRREPRWYRLDRGPKEGPVRVLTAGAEVLKRPRMTPDDASMSV